MKIRKQLLLLCSVLCLLVAVVWGQGTATKAPAGAAVRVTGLRTEATTEALGIDNPKPRFTWRVEASRSGVQQRAYRVVVATVAQVAASGQGLGLIWDSKLVRSSNPSAIYTGPAMSSRTRYYWTVRVFIAGETGSFASAATWFETAYLSASEWRGDWISGPKRLDVPPTPAQSLAVDACCLQFNTTLHAPVAAGETNVKVTSVAAIAPGVRFTLGGETVAATQVGTAAATTTLAAAAPAGATNIKVPSVIGFETGRPIVIGMNQAAISSIGTAAVRMTLAAAAAAGATTIQVTGAGGGGRGGGPGGIQAGDTVIVDSESRTVVSVAAPQGGRGGRGPGGPPAVGGAPPAGGAAQAGAPPGAGGPGGGRGGAGQPTTITITPALSSAHAQGATVEGLGTGISFARALTSAQPLGAAVSTPGTGITFTPALRAGVAAGSTIARVGQPEDFCRPKGGRGGSGSCREIRPVPMLRKSFTVDPIAKHGKVVAARVYSAGLAYNNMSLNGTATSDRFLDPPFTNYYDTVYYRTDDVTRLIRQDQSATAENVIATQLGAGHFDQESVTVNWAYETAEWRQTPRFRTDMYIEYADGTEQVIKSDGTWKVIVNGPTRYDDYYLGETYDARKEIPNWDRPSFDASSWPAAQVVDAPKGQMRAQRGDPTRLVANWPAGKRTNPSPGVYVWDTGLQRSGWATISVYGAPTGTPIQIAYSDKTTDAGTISAGAGDMQVDYYIAKGTGTPEKPELFTPQFTYKGHQYIQISSPVKPSGADSGGGGGFGGMGGGAGVAPEPLPDGVMVNIVSVHEVRTAMPASGTFSASNPLLTQIEKNTRAAIAENYVSGIITDTPQYEKNGWTGDAQLSVPTASLQFDTESQFCKSFQDMADAQEPTGELTLLAPTARGYSHVGQVFKPAANGGASPIWEAFWYVTPWESYLRYGDVRALEVTYPLMQKYLDNWIPQWTDKDGDSYKYTLTAGLGDWAPVTGADAPDGAPTKWRVPTIISPSVTAYYAYLAKITADTARALGNADDARRYDLLFENIKRDFNAKWWDDKAGYYREDPNQVFVQGMAVLPLAFGLVPDDKRADLQAKLVEDVVKTRDGHAMVGIASMRWILPVLSQAADEGVAGAADAAYAIMTQTTYPSYGYWISLGWTALGEYWEKSSRTRSLRQISLTQKIRQ